MSKHIVSCSFGKDSIATVILAREYGEPLDEIVYVEVMFDHGISGEVPEHRDFIYNVAIPRFKAWGYPVTVLHSEKTYMDCFFHTVTKGESKGKRFGFPVAGRCSVNRDCKTGVIKRWKKGQKDIIQYIGIAIDEPKRLKRLKGREISLLAKYGYTEAMAADLCKEYGLLSPAYSFTNRGGCFFCMNCKDPEIRHLREYHPDLWSKLLDLEKEKDLAYPYWNCRKKTHLSDKEGQFLWEDQQTNVFDFIGGENGKGDD